MDEFEYSVHISEQDWHSFFQECEECDLLPPSLAGLEDSGMSDMDEVGSQRARPIAKSRVPDEDLQIDGPPDCEGSPVELYLSKYGLRGPEHVLSGSEEDLHSQTINVFFERLKGFSRNEDCVMQKHQSNVGSEMAGHLEEAAEKADSTAAVGTGEPTLPNSSEAGQRRETRAQDASCSCTHNAPETNESEVDTSPDPQPLTKEEDLLQQAMEEGRNWSSMWKSGTEKEPTALVNASIDTEDPDQQKEANSQLVVNCHSDYKDVEAGQGQGSSFTPRRKRRRKKRVSSQPVQPDLRQETTFGVRQGESEDDSYVQRCEVVRETRTPGDCSSACVSEAFRTSVEHTPRLDLTTERGPVTGETAASGGFAIRGGYSPPESDVCDKEPEHTDLQSDDGVSAPTYGDHVESRLELNVYMPSPKESAPKASEILFISICDRERAASKTEARKPEILEDLSLHNGEVKEDKLAVLKHTALNSHEITAALQQPAVLLLDQAVCTPDIPHSEAAEILNISDPQDNSTAYQRKSIATISCVTFPEITGERVLSACYNNAEEEEGLACMSHDRVTPEHRNDSPSKESLSGMCESELEPQSDSLNMVKVQISHQSSEMNAFDIQMKSAQSLWNPPSGGTIKNAYSSEPKPEMDRLESEKVVFSNKCVIRRFPLDSQNEEWTEEVCPFLQTKDIKDLHESKEDQNMKETESLSPTAEARNEELSIKKQSSECQSHAAVPKLEPNPSIIITTSEEAKDQMHYVNMPPHFRSKEHKSSSVVTQATAAPTPGSASGVGDPGLECPATTNQTPPPPYAISSFWNEMEKLTINDILRLRLVGQAEHPGVLLQPEDSSMADASDAADSGYFTHLDDSKPDRSSVDMSLISDFDEEFAQLQGHDSAKLDEGSRESPYPGDIMWESQLDATGRGTEMEDVFMLSSETALPPPLFRDSAQQCFRKMCKNVSVQNLQTYEARPLGKILRNASLHSLHSVYPVHANHTEDEHDYEDPFDRVDTSSPVFLSDEEEELESPAITFSEIIQYLFGADEPDRCASVADNTAPSYLEGTGTTVPETYDHFFSEFEAESFFYPLAGSGSDELVPIFSCSRSATRTHHFPEVYDYFFPDDSPVHSDEDEEHEQTATRVTTQYDHTATESHNLSAASDTYEELFPESSYSWSLLWKNPLSFRRAQRATSTEAPEGSSSWALTPVSKSGRAFHGAIQTTAAMGLSDLLFLGLESSIFRQLAQQQKICSEMQTAVADPRVDASLMPLKQADMCLVCIAFASWVLKSVNPQGADTWKAALLANISALSAIRYLRRYMRDEATKKPPLRQIEPA